MGFGRLLWRTTQIGRTVDTIKSIKETGSIKEGYKKMLDETIQEDAPVLREIYKKGKYEGKKEGYVDASYEYEKKLLEQADEFLKQKSIFEDERDMYEELLDEYNKTIERLEEKVDRTEAENKLLKQLLIRANKLQRMA